MVMKFFMNIWYQQRGWANALLPLSWLFRGLVRLRRWWLEKRREVWPVPVVVVGNITVGGTGKTPLVIWLSCYLQQQGWRVGIVSRGYGAQQKQFPHLIQHDDSVQEVGDEPKLISQETGCPVVIDPRRCRAVKHLLRHADCNIVLSDDGLQHYAMSRVLEIVTVDGKRRFGNGHCLPAGPLREPVRRIHEADLVIGNGDVVNTQGYVMHMQSQVLRRVDGSRETMTLKELAGQAVNAVAGIGYPQRFFTELKNLGCQINEHAFRDHHHFSVDDFKFDHGELLVMTAKDAVKCQSFAQPHWWYLPVEAKPNEVFLQALEQKLRLIKLD